jgi:hypothetical protein
MKKGQIQTLCKAYRVVFKNHYQDTVTVLKKLKDAIQSALSMPNPCIFVGIVPERQGKDVQQVTRISLTYVVK